MERGKEKELIYFQIWFINSMVGKNGYQFQKLQRDTDERRGESDTEDNKGSYLNS